MSGAVNTRKIDGMSDSTTVNRLYWFRCKLNGQLLDFMLDSAATQCCIAKRCVTSSPFLPNLMPKPYVGRPLLYANQ